MNAPGQQRRQEWIVRALAATMVLVGLAHAPGAGAVDATTGAALDAALLPLLSTIPDSADAEQRDNMPISTSPPWGAIGFLDNGCTGTLIDSQHILAAAHCFTFDYNGTTANGTPYLQGTWQTGLVFFPNYHPARANPPRYAIDRVMVGSRVQDDPGQPSVSADWGIGHLATPVTGFPSLPLAAMRRWQYPNFVMFAGYARDLALFPQGPTSFPQPAPGGYCANFGGNCWWIPATIDPKCLATDEVDGFIGLDGFSCFITGGNSGSPILWNGGNSGSPAYRIAGVISGGGHWSTNRFEHAPRFAAAIAVASHDDGTARTQVFAADGDLGRVVSRSRSNTSPAGNFSYFRDLGAVNSPGPLAAFRLPNGRPQVVATGGNGSLFGSYVDAAGQWQTWNTLQRPAGVSSVLDVYAVNGSLSLPLWSAVGVPHLFTVGSNRTLYTTRASGVTGAANWLPWQKLPMGVDTQRVTAVRHGDGRLQVFVVSTAGGIQTRSQKQASAGSKWSAATTFSGKAVANIVDVAAAWDPNGHVQVYAIDKAGDGWIRTNTGNSPASSWGPWTSWSVPLYAPSATTPPKLDGIATLTATRWLESPGTVLPAVFATDKQGNIYLTTHENGAWRPWRSFYN